MIRAMLGQLMGAAPSNGLGRVAHLRDILTMRFGFQQLGFSEYQDYGLDRRSELSAEQRAAFLGYRRIRRVNDECNQSGWTVITGDKITFCTLMATLKLPCTRILAIFDRDGRWLPGAKTFTSGADVAAYLRNGITFPFFVKPNHGDHGRGAVGVTSYHPATDELLRLDGKKVGVEQFVNGLETLLARGQMFQEFMHPHPQLARLCGARATSVRMITGFTEEGPILVSAVWKIPTGNNMADNFMHGRSGNMLGAIELGSGRIRRVVGSVNGRAEETSRHIDTGMELLGIHLPCWKETCELALKATLAIPGYRLHHWDLALTPEGPVFLETNFLGDMDLHQIASGQGIWATPLQRVVADAAANQRRRSSLIAAHKG